MLNSKNLFILFTGLSGAGKTTLANALKLELSRNAHNSYILDGDKLRSGLCSDLKFSKEDRKENMRRIANVSALFMDAGFIAIAAIIAPFADERNDMRQIVGADNFIEVYVSTDLETCIKRDTKGLYKKALSGEIKNMTGLQSPYEKPVSPDLEFDTAIISIEDIIAKTMEFIQKRLS